MSSQRTTSERRTLARRSALRAVPIVSVVIVLVTGGCGWGGDATTVNAKHQQEILDLESQAGFRLPPGAMLIGMQTDPREPAFRTWVVRSPAAITTLPLPRQYGRDKDRYLAKPLADAVRYVESCMWGRRKIVRPTVAFASTWIANGFDFRGTVVRAADGDYLIVDRCPPA